MNANQVPRLAFVDFMYAIVVGSAFPLIAPLEVSFRFFGMLFLLLVVLEDFYLYHSEIQGSDQLGGGGFFALIMEISILLAWYLSAISFPGSARAFLIAFAAFYLLKLLAGFAHFTAVAQVRSWRFYRSLSFLIPFATAAILAGVASDEGLRSAIVWPLIMGASILQVLVWWMVTRRCRDVGQTVGCSGQSGAAAESRRSCAS